MDIQATGRIHRTGHIHHTGLIIQVLTQRRHQVPLPLLHPERAEPRPQPNTAISHPQQIQVVIKRTQAHRLLLPIMGLRLPIQNLNWGIG